MIIDNLLYENWKTARVKLGKASNSEVDFRIWIAQQIDDVW
jgi:hypothetical protein